VDREFAEAFKEEIELEERKMTDAEMAEREEIVKKLKPKLQSFKDKYGDDAKKVMYATATKQAMEEVEIAEADKEALKRALAISKFKRSGGKVEKQPPTPAQQGRGSYGGRGKGVFTPMSKEDEKMAKDIKDYKKKMKGIPHFFKRKKGKKEEVEINEISMEAGKVYHQDSSDGKMFFKAVEQQKNKRWKGLVLDIGQKKPKNGSADEKLRFWKVTPDKDIPSTLKEEVEIEEKKSATGYELYHKTFSDAMQHAYDHAKSKGFVVDKKEIDDKVATGPKKPSSGKTNRYSLKAGRKKVEIQVANLDNKRYELNMYIEGVDLGEGKSDKEHSALVATKAKLLMKQALKSGKKQSQDWWNKQAKLADLGESTKEYAKSLEKIARDRQISILSKSDKTTLLKIAALLDKEKKEDVEIEEAEIATSIGSGGTAGLDMGLTYKKKKEDVKKAKALRKQMMGESVQRTTFAGKDVFIVDSETFYNCRLGKKKYGRYEKYVGKGKVGQTIREYGLKYPRRPIILQNGESGPMLFLKYGRS